MTEKTRRFDPSASSLAGEVNPAVMEELLSVRGSIDNIDATLVYLLEEAHLDPAFAEKFLNFIISEVIRHHQDISQNHSLRDE